ncbi:hypothetical protein HELRODRAFT_173111 [Helobdella robusta]|uniref:Uncharacterized protein n=1 Tax=Helobdella robusta TaxID=6412 RepID=T1F6D5_HELRO|nr:hypothetical protein HELRODRAFT_173111 [Helobdella robusta]ESO04040.1 hypothetical protein HELRODRAFT_173111 [Helobdella robusta]
MWLETTEKWLNDKCEFIEKRSKTVIQMQCLKTSKKSLRKKGKNVILRSNMTALGDALLNILAKLPAEFQQLLMVEVFISIDWFLSDVSQILIYTLKLKKNTCTVMNRSGFVVLRINASHSLTFCPVNQINQTNDNNMHINCEEPGLANTLIEKNILKAQFCVNYDDQNHNITKFWNFLWLSDSFSVIYSLGLVAIYPV